MNLSGDGLRTEVANITGHDPFLPEASLPYLLESESHILKKMMSATWSMPTTAKKVGGLQINDLLTYKKRNR
jgi:hypothetical protein